MKKRASASCKSCQAPVIWAKSKTTGKAMQVDAEPAENGNILLVETGHFQRGYEFRVLNAADIEAARLRHDSLYVSHFATCPDADRHRRN